MPPLDGRPVRLRRYAVCIPLKPDEGEGYGVASSHDDLAEAREAAEEERKGRGEAFVEDRNASNAVVHRAKGTLTNKLIGK